METYNNALTVITTLQEAGYIAYFAGGWVRDFLLHHPSDDIDIATSAPPEIIQSLFIKTVPVGIQFGIVIVIVNNHEFEVATFRKDLEYQDGRRPSKIEFTESEEDAQRRDFTINGLFYDPVQEELYDFVEGKIDLEKKCIRAIGNPHERISEDRLRMIRAVRYATRFNFIIEQKTKEAILAHSKELFPSVAIERVYQELNKMHLYNSLRPSLLMLFQYGLLQAIFPELENITYEVLEIRLRPLAYFPEKSFAIAGIFLLFNDFSSEKANALSDFLKISNKERSFILFLCHAYIFTQDSHEAAAYAYFYANSFSKTCLEILGALHPKEKEVFLQEHLDRQKQLLTHIERIQNKNPLIEAKDLEAIGIKPGPNMGKCLKEAERISINRDINEKTQVLEDLKQSDLFKTEL